MPAPASRDRFFQQTHDDGEHTRPRKERKPRVQRSARGRDPFFASSDKQQHNDSDSEERREREEGSDDVDVSSRTSSHQLSRNNKRPRPPHTHTAANHNVDGEHGTQTSASPSSSSQPAQPPKRRKDAPLEMSSKHPTPLPTLSSINLLQPKSLQPRDPRFDSLLPPSSFSTHFNGKAAYKFVEELKEEEIKQMARLQKKVKSQAKREEVKAELQSVLSAKKETERKEREQTALRSWKKKEMAARREGKRPFYLKERDKKAVKLVSEYSRMAEKGQQGAIVRKLEKKRRQRAQSDQRSMPRQAAGGGQ